MTAHTKAELQVMWNRLLALVEEQGQILIRAAFSPIMTMSKPAVAVSARDFPAFR